MCKKTGYMSMINIPVWMFLSSYEKLRESLIAQDTFANMVHFGRGVFGSDFGTTAFVIAKAHINGYKGTYCRLFEKQGAVDSVETKEKWFLEGMGRFVADQSNFSKIPGSPVAYWVSDAIYCVFSLPQLGNFAEVKPGMSTTNNELFTRLWFEVCFDNTYLDAPNRSEAQNSQRKWFQYNKGGEYRKWYGNNDYVVNWENDGAALKEYTKGASGGRMVSLEYFFRECFTWSMITSKENAFRFKPLGSILSNAAPAGYSSNNKYILGLLNSTVAKEILKFISPTINCTSGNISLFPYKVQEKASVTNLVNKAITISCTDWDSYETSWDFKRSPLV